MNPTETPLEDQDRLSAEELLGAWPVLLPEDRVEEWSRFPRAEAEDLFLALGARDQIDLVLSLPGPDRRSWVRLLAPDDAADLIQAAPEEERAGLLALLDDTTRKDVTALLAYAEDDAGGLMNPRFARVRPDMSVDEAIRYLRRQTRERVESIYYTYVLDADQRLLGVVSFRDLFAAPPERAVHDVMKTDLVTASEEMDQEALSRLFAQHDLVAVPVVDLGGRMKGIVTVDDIVDVVEREATEDIHKIGGSAALEEPYLDVPFLRMVRKRAGWLTVLFFGEMLTTAAMGRFERQLAQVLVLALFVPLIISSGGNSGSQASTLVIRAMALGEVRLRDWWRVVRRELASGITLGAILGTIGLVQILLWPRVRSDAVPALSLGLAVGLSLVGVVLWGTVVGSMLPFVLRRSGFDPASASAPLVATLVDVSGLVIYFTVAGTVLRGAIG